jgi:hypothetical protein
MCRKCVNVYTNAAEPHFENSFMVMQNLIYKFHPDFHDYMIGLVVYTIT